MALLATCVLLSFTSAVTGFRLGISAGGLGMQDAKASTSAAVNDTTMILHGDAVNKSDRVLAAGVPSPDLSGDHIARGLGITAGGRCSAGAVPENLGCSLGCTCEWHQQCYPKHIYIDDGVRSASSSWSSRRVNVGACEPGMPLLIVASVCLFVGALFVVVTGRMLLLGQFAVRDAADAAAQNMPPAPYMKPPMVVVPAAGVVAQAQPAATASADVPRPSKTKKTTTTADSPPSSSDGPPSKPVVSSSCSASSSS